MTTETVNKTSDSDAMFRLDNIEQLRCIPKRISFFYTKSMSVWQSLKCYECITN